MALVQLGTIITNIKGSIGGTTFSNGRAGTIAKKRVTGKRQVSQASLNALSTSKLLTTVWNQLSAPLQAEFNAYALANAFTDRYGVTKQLTGFQWYKQLANANYYWNGTALSEPPAYATPDALPSASVFVESDGLRFGWSTPIDPDALQLFMFTTPPIKLQAALPRGAYRLTDVRSLDYSSFFEFTEVWEQAHGLNYTEIAAAAKFNINVLMVPINKNSLVSGLGVSALGSLVY